MKNFPCYLEPKDKESLLQSIKSEMRQAVKEAYQHGLEDDIFEWQMGKQEPCPECEKVRKA